MEDEGVDRGAAEPSIARDGGEPEARRREDGGGRGDPPPGSEAALGSEEPEVKAAPAARETWTPGRGTEKSDPADN